MNLNQIRRRHERGLGFGGNLYMLIFEHFCRIQGSQPDEDRAERQAACAFRCLTGRDVWWAAYR